MACKRSLRQLLTESEEIVMCPEIFDCSSAKCVEGSVDFRQSY